MENKIKRLLAGAGGVGFGAMELAINENRPDVAAARNLIENLIEEHGLSFIDTADCYCRSEEEFGYCERLLAPFTKRDSLLIASKVGMRREGTAWIESGSPKYLRSACERSLKNLGVEAPGLCQLHTPDPNVPLLESMGELSRLREEGKIRELGVCNVDLEQLREITTSTQIVSFQDSLSILFYDPARDNAAIEYCTENGITFIAYGAFGGHQNPYVLPTESEELNSIADTAGLSVYQLALLFLKSLTPMMIAIPGSISKEHILENLSVRAMRLPDEVKAQLIALAS